jgi:hypothetical protein
MSELIAFPLYSFTWFTKLGCGHVIFRGAPWIVKLRCPVCEKWQAGMNWLPVRREDRAWAN